MKKIIIINILLAGFLLTSCDAFKKKQQVGAAVELNGHYIYQSTLDSLSLGLDSIESARVTDQYIRQWAGDILISEQGARRMTSSDLETIDKMVADYKQTLLAQAYERKLIDRRMPKEFEDSVVLLVYNEMPDRFKLNESIVKGILVVVPKDAPKLPQFRKMLKEVSLDGIEKYVYQNASGYELFIDKWLTTTQLLSRIPVERAELENKIKYGNHIEFTDSVKTYILEVTDKATIGDAMPIEYARPQIEKILMNARQVEFLQNERKKMYEEAVESGKIQFYEN